MQSNVSIIVLMIIFVMVGMLFPVYNLYSRQDNISYVLVLKYTTVFVENVKNKGYLTEQMYTEYIQNLIKTGRFYDIDIEAHDKVFIQNEDNPQEYIEEYKIYYNEEIFEKASNPKDSILGQEAYLFDKGDQIYVKIRNENNSLIDRVVKVAIGVDKNSKMAINLGGFIVRDSWKNVRLEVK